MAERGWWVLQAGHGLSSLWYTYPATREPPASRSQAERYIGEGRSGQIVKGPFSTEPRAMRWLNAHAASGPAPSPAGQAPADPHGPQPIGVWAADILNAIGAPHTRNNVNNLAAWWQCESASSPSSCGYSLNYNNPFNTEHQLAGVTGFVCNSTQVPTYDTYAHGLAATLSTIREPFAAGIVQALRDDADRATFASAVQKSGWGSSGQCIASSPATGGLVSGTGLNPKGQPLSATGAAGCAPALIAIVLLILWALAW